MTNLKYLRLHAGMTQRELAHQLNIPEMVLNRCENGWFARAPRGIVEKLRGHYGAAWTWEKFMECPPEPHPEQEQSK
jgi:hypothetical protein